MQTDPVPSLVHVLTTRMCVRTLLTHIHFPPPSPCRAITREYAPQEDKARIQKKGIWAGKFQKPSDYRKDQKADGTTQSTQQQRPQQAPRPPQGPKPQGAQQLPLGPRPNQPSTSSVGAGTGSKPSYAGVLGKH